MDAILVELLGYKITWLEACAICTGLLCIIFAVKEKVGTFPLGLVSISLYFVFFYQSHLYSSMLLQVVFLVFNGYGWYKWTHPPDEGQAGKEHRLRVTLCKPRGRWLMAGLIVAGTLAWGAVSSNLHLWCPSLFSHPAQYAFVDSFVLVASLAAQYLLSMKKLENWVLWLIIDIVATALYLATEVWFTAAFYAVLVFTAVAGWMEWHRSYKSGLRDPGVVGNED